jgi:hypothetical protein
VAVLRRWQGAHDCVHGRRKCPDDGLERKHVGFAPQVAGHYIENTGDTDLVTLEIFKADRFMDVSVSDWLRRLPPKMVASYLTLTQAEIKKILAGKREIIAGEPLDGRTGR